ncbi:hypothetical protein AXF42_Ash009409 [Apostasia shenzhenica]|uniref:Uncharacterized protein n=1 Tax=Apostasia shenzhenica TaxID=1088818 RepID=A0A2I0B3Z4_9ASPA|nr:hypothetical protein AXF42_Ash009409 [Apostasia shenzhenica]
MAVAVLPQPAAKRSSKDRHTKSTAEDDVSGCRRLAQRASSSSPASSGTSRTVRRSSGFSTRRSRRSSRLPGPELFLRTSPPSTSPFAAPARLSQPRRPNPLLSPSTPSPFTSAPRLRRRRPLLHPRLPSSQFAADNLADGLHISGATPETDDTYLRKRFREDLFKDEQQQEGEGRPAARGEPSSSPSSVSKTLSGAGTGMMRQSNLLPAAAMWAMARQRRRGSLLDAPRHRRLYCSRHRRALAGSLSVDIPPRRWAIPRRCRSGGHG